MVAAFILAAMNPTQTVELPWSFWASFIAFVLFLVAIETPWVSRIWLPWLPRFIRKRIQYYFAPPPAVHPDAMGDPNQLPDAEGLPFDKRIELAVTRIVWSADHGVKDFGHYLYRFVVTVLVVSTLMLILVLMLEVIREVALQL